MTPSDSQIIEAMIALGGSFVQMLGRAWRHADTRNQQRLKEAFPEYWEQYRELAGLQSQRISER